MAGISPLSPKYLSINIAFLVCKLKTISLTQKSEIEISILCNNDNKFFYPWNGGLQGEFGIEY